MLPPTRVGDRGHSVPIVTSERRSWSVMRIQCSRASTRLRYPSVRIDRLTCPSQFLVPITMPKLSQPRSGAGGPLPQCPGAGKAGLNTRWTRMVVVGEHSTVCVSSIVPCSLGRRQVLRRGSWKWELTVCPLRYPSFLVKSMRAVAFVELLNQSMVSLQGTTHDNDNIYDHAFVKNRVPDAAQYQPSSLA